ALNHPHICTIYEVGEADGQAYIAMELVDGRPLDRVIPLGGLGVSDVFAYGLQIADAVAHAHDNGILHRDLKTANIMVTQAGRVKVLDFGLAKRLAREGRPEVTTDASTLGTEPGRVTGTLAYMAPEQLRGDPASAASDVWALGVVLHEMAAGKRPFDGQTGFEVASAILGHPPHALPETVPAGLQAVVSRCLAKDPLLRYRHAAELGAAIEAVRAGGSPAPQSAPPVSQTLRQRWPRVAGWSAAALVALVVLVVLVMTDPFGVLNGPARPASEPRFDSIAVLPLENLSDDPDEEYFAAGMQDGLITELARLRALDRVIERRSTRRFAGTTQPVTEIGAALGVDVVMTGAVLRVGDRVQVTAQLIDAATERHLWADRFERDAREVLSIQSDVAHAVATAIGIDLTAEERQRWATARPVDPGTYEAYLRGMYLLTRGPGTRVERQRGLAILQEAIDRDPGNAHAYAGLAYGYITLGHGPMAEADAWPRARAAALRAVTLDPTLAEAHSTLAEVRMYYEWDWPGAEESFRRANELNPNLAMNHYHYSWYLALFSRWEEAIAEHKRAQELDPLTPQHTAYLGALYLYQDRYDEAIAEARKAIDFAPNAPAAWVVLATGLAATGQHDEAAAAIQKGFSINPALAGFELAVMHAAHGKTAEARAILAELEAQPPTPWSVWSLSQLHIALGDHDGAFKWLAYRPAHAFLPWIRVHPPYVPIRKDPRFAALMAEMRLPMP
ncbi:MAG TPA: protein kinase, partial [Vicinamibacterales bacterium]|nr:protein kinase [Vicinamibacterales bacterium]